MRRPRPNRNRRPPRRCTRRSWGRQCDASPKRSASSPASSRVSASRPPSAIGPHSPTSHAALAALSPRYKLIILSNVDRRSFAVSNTRLGVRFDAIVTAEDVGSYKPSTRNFEALIETVRGLGVADGRLLHVAQSLFHDHVPARRLGLPTVWIDRRGDVDGWGATPPPYGTRDPGLDFPVDGHVRSRLSRDARPLDDLDDLELARLAASTGCSPPRSQPATTRYRRGPA